MDQAPMPTLHQHAQDVHDTHQQIAADVQAVAQAAALPPPDAAPGDYGA